MTPTPVAQPPEPAPWHGEVIVNGAARADPFSVPPSPPLPRLVNVEKPRLASPLREVVLEVITPNQGQAEPDQGHKEWLLPHQQLTVGRTNGADLSFPGDSEMSHIHFALECDWDACHLEDLKSGNGTFVNGERVGEAVLQSGDVILAGSTSFRVSLIGERGELAGPIAIGVRDGESMFAPPNDVKAPIFFSVEQCPADIVRFSPTDGEFEPAMIAHRLSHELPLHLIVDFAKLGRGLPEDLRQPAFLMDCFSQDTAARLSPVLFVAEEMGFVWRLIDEAWGQDALLCLFSNQSKAELLPLLRAAVRGEPSDSGLSNSPRQTVGYYRPSVLSLLLTNGSPQVGLDLCTEERAFFFERDQSWQIFAHRNFDAHLSNQGFVRAEEQADRAHPPATQPEPG